MHDLITKWKPPGHSCEDKKCRVHSSLQLNNHAGDKPPGGSSRGYVPHARLTSDQLQLARVGAAAIVGSVITAGVPADVAPVYVNAQLGWPVSVLIVTVVPENALT